MLDEVREEDDVLQPFDGNRFLRRRSRKPPPSSEANKTFLPLCCHGYSTTGVLRRRRSHRDRERRVGRSREDALEYLKLSSKIARDILELLIGRLGVELDESKIEGLIGSKKVNMNYYPTCPNPDLTVGVGRHSDTGIITVLLQDGIGGLYVKAEDDNNDGNGEWLAIPPISGALVINVGDALQILSNDNIHSIQSVNSFVHTSYSYTEDWPIPRIGKERWIR
ncbi:hypothetical protein P8452_56500 [Trifolium repens]|nr:hypothetical protein P8452_56500 [Trifolium repens]